MKRVCVPVDARAAAYGFPAGHPFGADRTEIFWNEMRAQGLERFVFEVTGREATRSELARFHTGSHLARVRERSTLGSGPLDAGDTPAFLGCYEAAACVVGSGLRAVEEILAGRADRGFVPVGGLHHAWRDRAAGFCIFNDVGVIVEAARADFGLRELLYVDIDAHHGDGVFYEFVADPALWIVDFHEDGGSLFPGTGHAAETGTGAAQGTKLNVPLSPGVDDARFAALWARAMAHLAAARPDLVLLQCGADSVGGDPLGHLELSPASHLRVTRDLVRLSEEKCDGRLLVLGGGGYDPINLAETWTSVVRALLDD
jgi:acetoin utilization protein AcuC